MQVETIYDIIVNVPLFHILHRINVYICEGQNVILTKHISVRNTVSA